MHPKIAEALAEMSPAEQIANVEEIWDRIGLNAQDWPLTAAQREELAARFEDFQASPRVGDSWEVVKARLLGEG